MVRADDGMGTQHFNFQRASCGLDAGVNIYSKRVDSVYETCKETLFGFQVLAFSREVVCASCQHQA